MSQQHERAYLSGGVPWATAEVEFHLRELRAQAEADRVARRVRGAHPLRRGAGLLLIFAGESLLGMRAGRASVRQERLAPLR